MANSSFELFNNGNVTVSSQVSVGDLIGALVLGTSVYTLTVIFFAIGLFGMAKYYIYSPSNNTDSTNAMNSVKLLTMPILWLVLGVIIYAFLTIFLESAYGIDVDKRVTFFLEARYDLLINNLVTTGTMLKAAKTVLLVVDLASKFVFWSLYLIQLVLYCIVIFMVFNVLSYKSETASAFQKVFMALLTSVIAVVVITFQSSIINHSIFKNPANIANVGTVSSVSNGLPKVLSSMIRDSSFGI